MSFEALFADRAVAIEPAAIRKVMSRLPNSGTANFTAGKPAPDLFPLERVYEKTGSMIEKYGPDALQYFPTMGFAPLREWIASRQTPSTLENVLIVAGGQQGIDMMGRLFLNPGDHVAVSNPTYTAALTTLRVYQAQFAAVDSDENGMLPASLERALAKKPKFIYAIPNFMNPTGVTTSLERRKAIISLAEQHGVPILEDDPYRDLRFEGDDIPSLYELAPHLVVNIGSFSKILAPGFRIGWMMADTPLINKLMLTKQTADLQANIYGQMLISEMIGDGFIQPHIERLASYYHAQRDTMLNAIENHFPPEVDYVIPAGGMFFWCELPRHIDTNDLLEQAIEQKVAFVPGAGFFADGSGKHTMRLSFSLSNSAEIERGIAVLGELIWNHL